MSNNPGSEASSDSAQLSTSVPDLSLEEAEALARRLYGIAGAAKLLTGERDENFRLDVADGRSYLLKISNPSEADEVVDLQTACLDHVARVAADLPVPRVLRTASGKSCDQVILSDGRRCAVRLFTYLEGIQAKGTPPTAAQRMAFGSALARLDVALQDFSHPAASHDLLWNVARADRLSHLTGEIMGAAQRSVVLHFMERFVDLILPRLGRLRAQVIHNDYHLYNILVASDDPTQVTGIIDFGDMLHAPLVGEVATAASYQMAAAADPLANAAELVGAYHAILPLLPEEQEVVCDLMVTRHLITVLISEWRAARYPENRPYIMRHNPASWEALFLMADLSRNSARDRLLANVRNGSVS
ncbi:phosphotransferase [Agrobacterium tumefaciens]|uniref:phosphotransferase n=1 Tax=Agrobacterium tumefaciens TaxID=358 RepID=UPI001572DB6A|nr:phosphotransferase [Agrobacterium tumefaciens]WCJ63357.1 phosphotransferase [Agrobacterium tumefaciens]